MDSYDVVVLGGGSGAERVASALADAGRRVAVVERRLVGGECPFFACMPSKGVLIAGARTMSWPDAMAFRDRMSSHGDDHQHAKGLAEHGVTIVRGEGRIDGPGQLVVTSDDGDTVELGWTDLVVATGADAATPPVEGLADTEYWTSEQALCSDEQPEHLVILGGGPIGCELAQAYARLGSEVTIVEVAPRLLAGEPALAGDTLVEALRHDGVEVVLDATVQRVEGWPAGSRQRGRVRLVLDDDDVVTGDRLLVVTGKRPRTDGIGLETVGISPREDGALAVDDRMQVAEHVWAVGDVTKLAPWTHGANAQGDVLVDVLLGGDRHWDGHAIPRSVYTDPAVIGVGRTDPDDDSLVVGRADFEGIPRATLEQRTDGGVELYADRDSGVLVGALAVGLDADTWASELVLAVHARLPVSVLCTLVHAFPTFGEVLIPAYRSLEDALRAGVGAAAGAK